MTNALSNLVARLKANPKLLIAVVVVIFVAIVGISLFLLQGEDLSNTSPTPGADASSKIEFEHVLQYNTSGNAENDEYVITSEEYGMLCVGNAYSSQSEAYANPVIVQAPSVIVSITRNYRDTNNLERTAQLQTTIPANTSKLASDSNYGYTSKCYLYVIVKPVAQEYDFTQDTSAINECVERYSSAPLNQAYGIYVVTDDEEGLICMGNAYSSPALAYANPLIIVKRSVKVEVSDVSGKNSKSDFLYIPGLPSKLISTSTLESQAAYIYVILKEEPT